MKQQSYSSLIRIWKWQYCLAGGNFWQFFPPRQQFCISGLRSRQQLFCRATVALVDTDRQQNCRATFKLSTVDT